MDGSTRELSRRRLFGLVGGALATAAFVGLRSEPARADLAAVQKLIAKIAGDRKIEEGRITLDAPEIAENGNTVPIAVEVDSPMTEDDYVKAVHLFAAGNPRPEVATFHFTPKNGIAAASTRIRLAKTQKIFAVAEMSDGSLFMTSREVKVTIGGCGG